MFNLNQDGQAWKYGFISLENAKDIPTIVQYLNESEKIKELKIDIFFTISEPIKSM